MTSQMTPEEANKVIEEEAANDDEFKDAVEEEEIEGDKTFEVTPEELSLIRAELASDFPEDYNYLSDAYILSVASKPYSKDPSVRRPIEVRRNKRPPRRKNVNGCIFMQVILSSKKGLKTVI
jgi:hypothetical protein